jgi:hypothetical protein
MFNNIILGGSLEASLKGFNLGNTAKILGPDTKLAMLVWSGGGMGKTTLAGGLDELTQRFGGQRTLYVPIEAGEGGGAITLQDKDIPYFIPKDLGELMRLLAALRSEKSIGGVVLDSGTEVVSRFVKPVALKYPCREKSLVVTGPRQEGVPTQSDYQVMGELTRQVCNELINLSTNPDPALKKHIIMTALDQRRTNDAGEVTFWGPALPGAMATAAVGMFQIVANIEIRTRVVEGKRVSQRYLTTSAEGCKSVKDRFRVFPSEIPIASREGDASGLTLTGMWEKYWIPRMEGGV